MPTPRRTGLRSSSEGNARAASVAAASARRHDLALTPATANPLAQALFEELAFFGLFIVGAILAAATAKRFAYLVLRGAGLLTPRCGAQKPARSAPQVGEVDAALLGGGCESAGQVQRVVQ